MRSFSLYAPNLRLKLSNISNPPWPALEAPADLLGPVGLRDTTEGLHESWSGELTHPSPHWPRSFRCACFAPQLVKLILVS